MTSGPSAALELACMTAATGSTSMAATEALESTARGTKALRAVRALLLPLPHRGTGQSRCAQGRCPCVCPKALFGLRPSPGPLPCSLCFVLAWRTARAEQDRGALAAAAAAAASTESGGEAHNSWTGAGAGGKGGSKAAGLAATRHRGTARATASGGLTAIEAELSPAKSKQ
jgi:hypothetical protein